MESHEVRYAAIEVVSDLPTYTVFRKRGNTCYYFDSNHICRIRIVTEKEEKHKNCYQSIHYDDFWRGKLEGHEEWHNYGRLDKVIACKIKAGQRLEDVLPTLIAECKVVLPNAEDKQDQNAAREFNRFFTIKRPKFHGQIGNLYEYIRVEVSLTSDVTKEIVYKYRSILDKAVLQKIEESNKYRKMAIPMSLYELGKLTMTADASLFYVFQLKEDYIETLEILG